MEFDAGISRRAAMERLIHAFRKAGIDEAAYDARLLLCAAAQIDHSSLIRDPDEPLGDLAAVRLDRYASRRLAREPVTRILASRGFWSLDIAVEPDVLDPRPDSETLIDAALKYMGERQDEALRIADLGSGSGALVCALLDVFQKSEGLAVDISPHACNLTSRNLRQCGFQNRARVWHGDWRNLDAARFDLIVSNPPYIPSADIATLDPEVRNHDPRLALDGGADGLDAFRSLAEVLQRLLGPAGIAIVEFGIGQTEPVTRLFEAGGLEPSGVFCDLAGMDRALVLKRSH